MLHNDYYLGLCLNFAILTRFIIRVVFGLANTIEDLLFTRSVTTNFHPYLDINPNKSRNGSQGQLMMLFQPELGLSVLDLLGRSAISGR